MEREFGEWSVSKNGDLVSKTHDILIESKMLARSNILEYLIDKNVNMNDLLRAYVHACKHKKIKNITFNLS